MTPSSAVRSFAITLAIAITLVGPRVSGFTIHRTNNKPTTTISSTDLYSEASLQLQVKHDKIRSIDDADKNENSNETTISNATETFPLEISQATEESTGKYSSVTLTAETIRSTTENVKIPTISSDTVEVFDSIEDTKVYNETKKINNNTKELTNLKELKIEKPDTSEQNVESAITPTSFEITQSPTEMLTTVDHVATKSDKIEDYFTRKTIARSILGNDETTQPYNETEIPLTKKSFTEVLTSTPLEDKDGKQTEFLIITDLPSTLSKLTNEYALETNTTTLAIEDISKSTESSSLLDSDMPQTTTENLSIEPISGIYPKDTTIIKKRTTFSEETTAASKTEDDNLKADTFNTQINFAKGFGITPISSLEKLRVDLLSYTNQPSISKEESHETEKVSVKVTRELESTTSYTIEDTEPNNVDTVESKRAGYLDNTEKRTSPINASIIGEIKETVTKTYGTTVEDSVSPVTESPEYKKVSGLESQSQLAEDALQEEFLKEKALNNHKENALRYHDMKIGIKDMKLETSGVSAGNGTEDTLSVQPIDRTKTTLYTPSPNYKPMKKIDVQPAKLFVRDPDDNSWRNESISSLGIVFKPKNSSKSFKEVLKNKTQSELNNLIERAKDDVPDLRVRLEKIAEVRKTKKKKMNNDGEVVYTDYEENSSETSSTLKPEEMNFIADSVDIPKTLTTSNFQSDFPVKIDLELTTPMTPLKNVEESTEKTIRPLDIFSRIGLDALTTQKPRKFFNIAEYYDTTDEYDADYVTMSKIDLKKFTVPPRTTRPTPLITKPIEPYVPDRRPTIQYFPPREPHPVNVNNVDKDFERKINLFTFKDHSRLEPRPAFVAIPPLPIATMKPESEMRPLLSGPPQSARPDMRPTVKPTDFEFPSAELNKSFYMTNSPTTTESEAFLINSGRLDRGSYVIKHYKDFLKAAVDDDERNSDFLPYHTTEPPRETFATEADKQTFKPRDDEEDYDSRFRKDVLTRFVDNFNQNSERFKVDFPILYNTSVVHTKEAGPPALSRTFLKRLYHEGVATRANGLLKKPCEPNCELTVDLSPAYELHYYVPNQEEREEQEPRTSSGPYRYGL